MKTTTTLLMAFVLSTAFQATVTAATMTLIAKVTNEHNQPIENADAMLVNPENRQVIKAKTSTNKGEYLFENIDEGSYILTVSTSDKKQLETEKVVMNGMPVSKEVKVKAVAE
ncbi:MAG: carboxypeptidase-like regulatory domain-containing protein [Paludibacter sp.]|jgi:hypothetical protein|nr:carboxypeptidase-like regulatory domain-containing protein [Paludibacter sp.]